MNWDAIGAIAEIVAAGAVIVTLLYLAFQISQNTRTLKRQGQQSARERFLLDLDQTTKTRVDAEIFRNGLNDFDNLPPVDQGCFHSKMHTLIHGFHHVWDMHRAGLLPDIELAAMRDLMISYLITPGAQQWWAMHKTVAPPDIVSFLDEAAVNAKDNIAPATERFSWLRID
jgi:hypothetical protein